MSFLIRNKIRRLEKNDKPEPKTPYSEFLCWITHSGDDLRGEDTSVKLFGTEPLMEFNAFQWGYAFAPGHFHRDILPENKGNVWWRCCRDSLIRGDTAPDQWQSYVWREEPMPNADKYRRFIPVILQNEHTLTCHRFDSYGLNGLLFPDPELQDSEVEELVLTVFHRCHDLGIDLSSFGDNWRAVWHELFS